MSIRGVTALIQPKKETQCFPGKSSLMSVATLTDTGHFTNGVTSNAVMCAIMMPGYTLKTYAMKRMGLPPVSKLYNGLPVCCISGGPAEGIAFLTQHTISRAYQKKPSHGEALAISFLAGVVSAPPNSLCERAMIQQQINGGSMFSAMRPVFQQEGIFRGLCKGIVPTAGRDGIYNCTLFALNDLAKEYLTPWISNREVRDLTASLSVGAIGGYVTAPLDLIKTQMQSDYEDKYLTVRKTARAVFEKGGFKALMDGAGIRAVVIAGSIYFLGKAKDELPVYFPSFLHRTP